MSLVLMAINLKTKTLSNYSVVASLKTSTTDLNANQSGISSPDLKSCLNLVPDSFN